MTSSGGKGREVWLPCALSKSSALPLLQYSSLQKNSPFSPLASQTSQPRPTPAFSLPFFPAFLSSLHFLFPPHSLLFIRFPESAGGFNFQNDYKEPVQGER
ncbi:unnamed protein product [Rangifer tarandus platyrhynchus]|uniref:Uncharacterized protein n=1 Tax=Rangifer tarandus platyrhynchus TaxID=3082113 RepID=A0ABN9A2L0_RANTA|nr:unnamed protein product [Rangifer tarandus platyrhynchus]CAI9180216.1 unnamed protein product [Rangifer tarandus platyrhynchus]CAI9180219.1 unnamed protein product [Rangifer tarandus platyrhynchus]